MLKQTLEDLLAQMGLTDLPAWAEVLIAISNVLLILFLAWLAKGLIRRVIRAFATRLHDKAECPEDKRRVDTLQQVFGYLASVVIGVITFMLVLSELGISIAPILATAGVAGIAIGFGAQSLVKDYFTGFVMLIENQIRQGDVVEVAGKTGSVEEVTLRYVRLRDYEGAVHYIPNGVIDTVTNRSRVFAFSVMDIGVAYKEDLERVFNIMRKTAQSLRQDPTFSEKILDDLEIAGVDQWADSAVVIKCRLKVVALEQWVVRREFLRRLKLAFDEGRVEIPFPHRTVYTVPASSQPSEPAAEKAALASREAAE